MIKEIKKGDRFVCVSAPFQEGAIVGKVYTSDEDGSVLLEHDKNSSASAWCEPNAPEGLVEFNEHFIHYDYKSVEKYILDLPRSCEKDIAVLNIFYPILGKLYAESITDDFEENNLAWAIGGSQEIDTEGCGYIKTGSLATSAIANVGDWLRCLSELEVEGIKFAEWGYSKILAIEDGIFVLDGGVRIANFNIDEFFVVDNRHKVEWDSEPMPSLKGGITLPSYYDNTNGSLYQIAEHRGWNFYQADAVKRIDRALKKGNFKQDIEKTIALLQLWLRESGEK